MIRNAKTQSAPAAGRLRLALLLATAAAFLLVPASQAAAASTMKVNLIDLTGEGAGGEVETSNGLIGLPEPEPRIHCFLPEGVGSVPVPVVPGVCEGSPMFEAEPGVSYQRLERPSPKLPNSEFLFWEIASGFAAFGCAGTESGCTVGAPEGVNAEVNLYFACEAGKECLSTEHFLTVSKSGSGSGWVHSSPAGINCGLSCPTKEASFAAGAEVTLTAYGLEFEEWETCPGSAVGNVCTVTVNKAKEAVAKFEPNVFALTVTKIGGGEGWVHSTPAGINCGLSCTTKTAFFEEGTEVTLTAYGLQFNEWTSCPGSVSANACEGIVMSENKAAEVKFE